MAVVLSIFFRAHPDYHARFFGIRFFKKQPLNPYHVTWQKIGLKKNTCKCGSPGAIETDLEAAVHEIIKN